MAITMAMVVAEGKQVHHTPMLGYQYAGKAGFPEAQPGNRMILVANDHMPSDSMFFFPNFFKFVKEDIYC